jgi:hypothetical protein
MARPLTYSDPISRTLRITWNRSRAQARSRGEEWLISWEDYYYIWTRTGAVNQKGRSQNSICLARKDPKLSWTVDNVSLELRSQHLQRIQTGVPKTKTVALD